MALPTKSVSLVSVHDLEDLIRKTYERPYSIIAWGWNGSTGSDSRGNYQETMLQITVPEQPDYDLLEHAEGVDMISYRPPIEGDRWVRPTFEEWRDQPYPPDLNERQRDPESHLFMRDHRLEDTYCCALQPIVNDLHARGLIEAGDYVIRIWW